MYMLDLRMWHILFLLIIIFFLQSKLMSFSLCKWSIIIIIKLHVIPKLCSQETLISFPNSLMYPRLAYNSSCYLNMYWQELKWKQSFWVTKNPAGKMDDNLIIGFNLLYEFILCYHIDLWSNSTNTFYLLHSFPL